MVASTATADSDIRTRYIILQFGLVIPGSFPDPAVLVGGSFFKPLFSRSLIRPSNYLFLPITCALHLFAIMLDGQFSEYVCAGCDIGAAGFPAWGWRSLFLKVGGIGSNC